MNGWLTAILCSALSGIAVYLWRQHAAAKEVARLEKLREEAESGRIFAEREKSNADVAFEAKCAEFERLRNDFADGLKRQAEQFRNEISDLNAKLDSADAKLGEERKAKESLSHRLAAAEEALKASEKMMAEKELQYAKTLEQGTAQFKEIAQKILEDREKKLKEDATNPLGTLVQQLKQDIENLKKNIASSDEKSATTHTALMAKIAGLLDQTNKVTEQANNLASAIRGDVRLMGEWGEIQLKRVLDMSGMVETQDYTYQETFRDDETGRRTKRTDFVVRMPGERSLIIDSKCTIAAAERFHAAQDDASRLEAEAELVNSVRKHIEEIKDAAYQESVPNAFPTVLMYIPLEEVYLFAMKATVTVAGEQEPLREFARRHHVEIVNSSSVVPVVKLVEMMWNVERSERNRQEMIRAAEELLSRANDFIVEFVAVGDAFREVFGKYENAKAKLVDAPGGRSITKAVAKLVSLGVQPRRRGGRSYELAAPVAECAEDGE